MQYCVSLSWKAAVDKFFLSSYNSHNDESGKGIWKAVGLSWLGRKKIGFHWRELWEWYWPRATRNIFIQIWQSIIWEPVLDRWEQRWFCENIRLISDKMRFSGISMSAGQIFCVCRVTSGIFLFWKRFWRIMGKSVPQFQSGQAARKSLMTAWYFWKKILGLPESCVGKVSRPYRSWYSAIWTIRYPREKFWVLLGETAGESSMRIQTGRWWI